MKKKYLKRIGISLTAAAVLACFLSACGPEPGKEGTGPAGADEALFGETRTEEASGDAQADGGDQAGNGNGNESAGTDGAQDTSAAAGQTGADDAAAGGSGMEASAENPSRIPADMEKLTEEHLAVLQDYLNEDSSYGFLLSTYERPQEIDLNQVFYSGAGFPQGELKDREKELLLERIPQDEIRIPVVKVTQDQIEELLDSKAGISSEDSVYSFEEMEDWSHIGRYDAWYALRGDTNRKYITCTDGWQQGNLYVVHYTLSAQKPEEAEPAQAAEKTETAGTGETSAAAGETGAEAAASVETSAEAGETGAEAAASVETSAEAGEAGTETASAGETSAEAGETGAETAAAVETSAAAGETGAEPAGPAENATETTAFYQPVYEVQLRETTEGWRFCSNILWAQKDMIEAQSYRAELSPGEEVFFAPFLPDTEAHERADVTFALVKDHALMACLAPMEKGNVRTDRIFTGVDAVDFTDYNGDGYTDILTICTYTRINGDGKKEDNVREARVYTGQKETVPLLDEKKTAEVNRQVETLNITNVTKYLSGKSDGKAEKYSSWKEAYADHVRGLAEDEYEGFALINLNEDSTPELVQMGATDAKGATIIVYRNGTLEETWLNRRNFQYLEYENLLYSESGVENLHFDTIYSIVSGRLGISVQGYYGNSRFAAIQCDENGKASYDYYWDGGEVSENGYRDGITFVFDLSRARTCDGETLLTAEELMKELQ